VRRRTQSRWKFGRDALVGVRRASLRDLAAELATAELNSRELVPIGQFAREALAARVTADALERRELMYLGAGCGFPGISKSLDRYV